jgi:hypothetical protein
VRITRDVLARSFNETKHLVREPVGVDFCEYDLLENEPALKDDECSDLPWEAVLMQSCDAVPQVTLDYWRSYQAFAKDRRVLLSKSDTAPRDIEAKVKEEWKKMKFADALKNKKERAAQQQFSDIHRSIGVDPSMPSGNAPNSSATPADPHAHDSSMAESHDSMVKRMATAPPSAEATRASKRVKTSHTPAATNASASAATPASGPI